MSSAITLLDDSHDSALRRAISNVVDTNLAIATYAQIIDGLPTEDVAWDRSRHKLRASHPLSDHVALCPGVLDKLNAIKADFQIESLLFSSSVLEAFQSSKEASQNFKIRLLELTAVALHQIAVHLFQLKANLHDPATTQGFDIDSVVTWKPEPDEFLVIVEPWPTLFAHRYFTAHEQYPNGIADIVGYWAEDRILGGVAIFDRSEAWTGDDEPNVYFQSCRKWATWRVWQLLPEQQESLVEFVLQDPGSSTDSTDSPDGPLPLMPSRANTVRLDPGDAIPVHKVYRDVWEREPPPKRLRMQEFMAPCVVNSDDYPEMESAEDELKRLNDLHRRMYRIQLVYPRARKSSRNSILLGHSNRPGLIPVTLTIVKNISMVKDAAVAEVPSYACLPGAPDYSCLMPVIHQFNIAPVLCSDATDEVSSSSN